MRKVRGHTLALTALAAAFFTQASADDSRPYYLNRNQTRRTLPGVTMPHGSDEIRASDGAACKSGLSSNGAYMDAGVIGMQNQDSGSMDRGAVYGRVAMCLDCAQFYDLEIARLKMELEAAKLSMQGAFGMVDGNEVGWTTEGLE